MYYPTGSPEGRLDDVAAQVWSSADYGNRDLWRYSFRSGLNGMRSRLSGLMVHYDYLYKWDVCGMAASHEHHQTVMWFCMDSAIECLVFGLNALGQVLLPDGFRSIADEGDLKRISPWDVMGQSPLAGWSELFPEFQKHLNDSELLLRLVMNSHDVSKHRMHTDHGGEPRQDPPEGFFESIGVPPGDKRRLVLAPMASVSVPLDPKIPVADRGSGHEHWTELEKVYTDFWEVLPHALALAASDAEKTIPPLISADPIHSSDSQ